MKNLLSLLIASLFTGLLLFSCSKKNVISPVVEENPFLKSAVLERNTGKYIIVLKTDAGLAGLDFAGKNKKIRTKALGLLKKHNLSGEIEEVYETALQGFTIRLNAGQAKNLESDPEIKRIEEDKVVTLSPVTITGKIAYQPAQAISWGVNRIGGPSAENMSEKTAWIIDTGIDLDHPDLNVNAGKSASFNGPKDPNDRNGHGTHVAGIIGAKNNEIGVIGVAPGANLVAVRVLDHKGRGNASEIIAGVNYVAANALAGDIANMSIGISVSPSLDEAVINASQVIKFVIASGNESTDSDNLSPARVNGSNIYTVSAMDNTDNWAYFSNFGASLDYCAPGVSIRSTYKDGGYATGSGTSMAAPHVSGILLIGEIMKDGFVKGDPDGDPDPIAHK